MTERHLNEAKNKRNRRYKISIITILVLLLIATFGTETGRNTNFNEKLMLLLGLLFVFTVYLRMYNIYKLEKFQDTHNHISFVDFFNNNIHDRLDLIFEIVPILKRFDDRKLEIIRFQINFLTFFAYLFILTCICLMTIR